jgi:RHS repeat-associated protein
MVSTIDIPYRFTGKEKDEETGLYYYGARYLDPKFSRWLSPDPALSDYIPGAPINEEAKKRNGNLPGMGGVFNTVNLHLYHYAGNNPVKYVDPTGREDEPVQSWADFLNSAVYLAPDPDSYMSTDITDRIKANADDNLNIPYGSGNQCDDFVANILTLSDVALDDYFAGNTESFTVDQHIAAADARGNSSNTPNIGANVVFMNESDRGYNSHAGLLFVNADGSVELFHSSSSESGLSRSEPYDSVQAFQNAYGYSRFHYITVR